MEGLPIEILLALVVVAGLAGMVDAIAGGGGLIALPALLEALSDPSAEVRAVAREELIASTSRANSHFIPVGKPAPPRPRRRAVLTARITSAACSTVDTPRART